MITMTVLKQASITFGIVGRGVWSKRLWYARMGLISMIQKEEYTSRVKVASIRS